MQLLRAIAALGLLAIVGCSTSTKPTAGSATAPATARAADHTFLVGPIILGADITWAAEDEAAGATYFDQGVRKDLFVLLHDRGFNYVRLRVFVDPKSAQGYARRMPEAFGDIAHTLALAKRAKALGMGVLIDLHFSDGWADPEHQVKPVAWQTLPFDALVEAARAHTQAVVQAMLDQGTPPDMIQIGNEITHGMLWPDARVASLISSGNAATDERMRSAGLEGLGHYDELATVLKACIAEVRTLSPATRVAIHNHLGRSSARVQEWLDALWARGVRVDVVGFSCYAQGKEGDWQQTFADIVRRYPQLQIAVLEYSARKRYINDLVHALPDGRGIGTFIWEPTRHREALFDQNGQNAGGGQASNFIADLSINQGATTRPAATRPATTRTGPATRPRSHGGRYDANTLLDLYPQMRRDYDEPDGDAVTGQ